MEPDPPVGRGAHRGPDLERPFDALLQPPLLHDRIAIEADREPAERRPRVGEDVPVHQRRQVARRDRHLGVREPERERALVVEDHHAAAAAAHGSTK
jgi:hypothetical protein